MKLSREILTSRSNPKIKWASSLSSKKTRQNEKSFIAEGKKLTLEALDSKMPVTHIFVSEAKRDELLSELEAYVDDAAYAQTEIITVGDGAFEKISTEKSPEGIIAVIKYLDTLKVKYLDILNNTDIIYKEEFFLEKSERALVLSSVRDPGNLGAVIRSATAFGVDHIIVTADSADVYNHKTVRAAMGSLFRTKITVVERLDAFIRDAQRAGRRVFAAELTDNASEISTLGLNREDIFIIGNEGHGISSDISALCDRSAYIPISKKTESLNAAVAAAILMWEQSK
ncbi:MAG: RNA methyltransferase [Clostridia bacterium]|nr:RNA methyltransferase [Clostridia bacterium]